MKTFQPEFQFGVGNSDHQCEAYDPNCEDIRDVWDRVQGNAQRGKATDFGNRFSEDIQLAAQLGCKVFRFSVSWARVEPRPGEFDASQIAHYRRIVDCIVANGMQPLVTLIHFTWPIHVQDRGGMLAEDFPSWVAAYAGKMANAFGPHVVYWITFNEPNVLSYGYSKAWWEHTYHFPPGLPDGTTSSEQIKATAALIRNLFLAHTQARKAIQVIHPQAKAGTNPSLLGLPLWLQRLVDRTVTRVAKITDFEENGAHFAERALVVRGKVDVVAATLTVTEGRQKEVDFSEVYYIASQALLVPLQSAVTRAEDLAGKTVAVVEKSTAQERIASLLPGSRPLVVADHRKGLEAIGAGDAAALLSDDSILLGLLSQFPGKFKIVAGGMSREPYALAVTRGNPSLLEVVDIAIRQFEESGGLARSIHKYVGDAQLHPAPRRKRKAALARMDQLPVRETMAGKPWPLAAKGTLLRRIQDRGFLEAAVHFNAPGFGYRDERTGELSGLEIDLCREVARVLFADASKVRFSEVHTRERIPFLRSILEWFDPLFRAISILSSALNTNWWHLGMAGRLPEFLCPRECVGQQDFIGFDYYWGISSLQPWKVVQLVESLTKGRFDLAPVAPAGLYSFLKFYARLLPGKEIVLVENGCVDAASGIDRVAYLQRHLHEVQKAVDRGIPISNFIVWSITCNF